MLQRLDMLLKDRGRSRFAEGRPAANAGVAFPYFLIAAVILPIMFFGLAAYRDWRAVDTEATSRVAYIRDALTEHALRVFKTHRLVAFAIEDRIGGMTWDEIAGSAGVHTLLRRIEQEFPEVHAIWLIDENGLVRASSRPDMPGTDVGNQTWFGNMRTSGRAMAIGIEAAGGGAPARSFTITFRRTGQDGAFEGVVRMAISSAYFNRFYASAYPDAGAIALVHADGTVLVRYPDSGAVPSRLPADSPLMARIAEADEGIFKGGSTIDGQRRIYAFAQVPELPIYVGFGVGEKELSRQWRERVSAYLIYAIPAIIALGVLAAYAWRSHRDLEETIELRTLALSSTLAEKEQLLKEVHHRVKNNMQIISSLIRMQEEVRTSPDETIRRVQAMALVHDLVYSHGAFASVDLSAYARRLGQVLHATAGDGVRMTYNLEPVTVALDRAMPFALILSEVVGNALKHAFPNGEGTIEIALESTDGDVVLCVHDDGPGFNREVDGRGFGMRLIKSLALQLDADATFERNGGTTTFRMRFPLEEEQPRSARAGAH